MIGRRLARLSEPCRALLARASAIGVEVDLELLARLERRPAAELLPMLDEAAAAHLLREPLAPGAPWRFRHSLVRDVLYSALPTSVRTGLHRAIGEALETLHGADVDQPLAELAHHYVRAAAGGDPAKAIAYSGLAAARASQLYAHEEAERHLRVALALTTDDVERCGLLLALGEAATAAGDQAEARTAFLRAADLARRLGLADELARAAIGYGGRFAWLRAGDDERIVPLLEQALAALPPGDSIPRARLLARLAGALRDEPSIERRDDLSREALEMARRLGDPGTLSYAILARWPSIGGPDRTAEMQDLVRELRGIAIEGNDRERLADSLWFTLIDVTTSGRHRDGHPRRDGRVRAAGPGASPAVAPVVPRRHADDPRAGGGPARGRRSTARGDATARPEDPDLGLRRVVPARPVHAASRAGPPRRDGGPDDRRRRALPRLPDVPEHRGIHARERRPARRRGRGPRRDRARWLRRCCRGTSAGSTAWSWRWTRPSLLGDRDRASEAARLLEPYAGRFAIASGEEHGGPVDRVLGLAAALDGRLDEAIVPPRDGRPARVRRGGVRLGAPRVGGSGRSAPAARRPGRPGARARARIVGGRPGHGRWAVPSSRPMRAGSWRRRGGGRAPQAAPVAVAGTSRPTLFRREGDVWAVGAEPVVRIRDAKGMQYLATLLAQPGREFHALDLAGGGTADPETRAALAQASEIGGCGGAARRRGEGRLPGADRRAACADRSGGAGRHGRHRRTCARRARGDHGRAVRSLRPRWSRTTDRVCRRASAPERQQGRDCGHRAHRGRRRGAGRPPRALGSDRALLHL